jgi:transposase
MELAVAVKDRIISPEAVKPEGEGMIRRDVWDEIRRRNVQEGIPIREIARDFGMDRNTIRRCLRQKEWCPYTRTGVTESLLSPHEEFLRARAPEVDFSARILYQELVSQKGYRGSYDTVKIFIRPLRAARMQAERALVRFETPPGLQSQIDWGQARVRFRSGPSVMHLFALTLGFSRRTFYCSSPNERISPFLEAHERAFDFFGGHTREHLYDRTRTVCFPSEGGKVRWNPTFKAFADYWGFEPRLCAPYRAQTKGKVESGIKYIKRNFLPGRVFVDRIDFDEQLSEWMATVADVRIHGTTHERPIDRFVREKDRLVPLSGQPSFHIGMSVSRIVADDYLVSFRSNRYSVPFPLIGQTVDVLAREGQLQVLHRGTTVAVHPLFGGRHQLRILPEHGPGPGARTARRLISSIPPAPAGSSSLPQVEVRDLAVYDALLAPSAKEVSA